LFLLTDVGHVSEYTNNPASLRSEGWPTSPKSVANFPGIRIGEVGEQRGQPIQGRENGCAGHVSIGTAVFLFGLTSDRSSGSVIGDSFLREGSVQDIAGKAFAPSRVVRVPFVPASYMATMPTSNLLQVRF
jgi:hypothetical protein